MSCLIHLVERGVWAIEVLSWKTELKRGGGTIKSMAIVDCTDADQC